MLLQVLVIGFSSERLELVSFLEVRQPIPRILSVTGNMNEGMNEGMNE